MERWLTVREWFGMNGGLKLVALLCATWLLVMAIVLAWRAASSDAHKRGSKVLNGWRARRRAARQPRGCNGGSLSLAGVQIAPLEETKHFKLIGTTGTGKSTA